MNNEVDTIIFDFDGTLFQTEKLVIPSFEKTFARLEAEGYYIGKKFSEEELLSVIGKTLEDIWQTLLPHLSLEAHKKANDYMLHYEIEGVSEGYGALYPQVIETLLQLKNQGYRLFVASNGLETYIKELAKAFRIDHYFEAMYSAGEFETKSKNDLVKKLVQDYSIENGVMVGDRQSDVEAGKTNKLFVIGCDFGFSSKDELKNADVVIQSFDQILAVLNG
ncbi:HAD family hydrolase [Tepidibacillus infernus]|uniref:HAD family hydrolase n=1 Tax=Tepidibacillus TaxID=1494427 RepID=UPI0008538281|nr:HAD-IA family hydrolase [Tepidibacillus sp. HK-1]GBF12001.1 5'-nucleotidase [Tepidibacillus sp. HK-1]